MSEKNEKNNMEVKEEIKKAEKELAEEISETEEKVVKHKITQKQADKEIEKEVKEEVKKVEEKVKDDKKKKKEKTEAIVNGRNIPISTKHSIAICNYIRGKNIDMAISMLEEVENFKKAIPMKGEIPHKRGIMSGRYPVKAVKEFIKLLKGLKANAIVNELELEKFVIFCKADIAARPYRRFGRTRFKRTHVTLKLIQPIKKNKNNKRIKNTEVEKI